MTLQLDLPEGAAAVVLLAYDQDGSLTARYAEGNNQVPVLREHAAKALMRLAITINRNRLMLDNAERASS